MSHWGLYIIRVNHSLKGTLNEDEPRVRTNIAPKFPTLSAERRWTCPGDLWIWYPFFHFPVFDTLNAIRALRARWWKYTLFTRSVIYADDVQAPMRHVNYSSELFQWIILTLLYWIPVKSILDLFLGKRSIFVLYHYLCHPLLVSLQIYFWLWKGNCHKICYYAFKLM